MKELFLLPLLCSSSVLGLSPLKVEIPDKTCFNLEEKVDGSYKLVSVADNYINDTELRIYNNETYTISEIAVDAFKSCTNLTTLMVTSTVTSIDSACFNEIASLRDIYYTSSEEDFNLLNLNLRSDITVNFYGFDEGFINYWKTFVRPSETSNICDVSKETYQVVSTMYDSLSEDDKERVNKTNDVDSTIFDSLKYLEEKYKTGNEGKVTKEASKSTMIVFILLIASLGMTFICVFYILKERKIIG